MIFGRSEVGDREIETFLAKRDAFMKFRMVTGVKPRTPGHIGQLIKWCDENNEDIGDVKACGSHFDLDAPSLKAEIPDAKRIFLLVFLTVVIALLTAFMAIIAFVSPSMIQIKKSEHWYFVERDGARRVDFLNTEPKKILLLSECVSSQRASRTPYIGPEDKDVLCQLMDSSAAAYRDTTLQEQRWVLGGYSAILLFWTAAFFQLANQAGAARSMARRLKDRQKSHLGADRVQQATKLQY